MFLENAYLNPKNCASFSNATKLYTAIETKFPCITLSDAKEWLPSQDTYTLHKPARKKFKRNKIIVHGVDDQWQVDLVNMYNLAKLNNGNRYILTCINILSKYGWASLLKAKTLVNIIKFFCKDIQAR